MLEIRNGSGLKQKVFGPRVAQEEKQHLVKLHLMRSTIYLIKSATLVLKRITQELYRDNLEKIFFFNLIIFPGFKCIAQNISPVHSDFKYSWNVSPSSLCLFLLS